MDTMTITKDSVKLEIERLADKYGQNHVIASLDEKTACGRLAGIPTTCYPRIEFMFKTDGWLHEHADSSGWILDDYESAEEAKNRPPDTCTYNLTPDEVIAINAWRIVPVEQRQPSPAPQRQEYVEPIYAIGGLNVGDGAEPQAPWPVIGQICRICGQAESWGAMFTTLGTDICDDCA